MTKREHWETDFDALYCQAQATELGIHLSPSSMQNSVMWACIYMSWLMYSSLLCKLTRNGLCATKRECQETDLNELLLLLSSTNIVENSLAASSESGSFKRARERYLIFHQYSVFKSTSRWETDFAWPIKGAFRETDSDTDCLSLAIWVWEHLGQAAQ